MTQLPFKRSFEKDFGSANSLASTLSGHFSSTDNSGYQSGPDSKTLLRSVKISKIPRRIPILSDPRYEDDSLSNLYHPFGFPDINRQMFYNDFDSSEQKKKDDESGYVKSPNVSTSKLWKDKNQCKLKERLQFFRLLINKKFSDVADSAAAIDDHFSIEMIENMSLEFDFSNISEPMDVEHEACYKTFKPLRASTPDKFLNDTYTKLGRFNATRTDLYNSLKPKPIKRKRVGGSNAKENQPPTKIRKKFENQRDSQLKPVSGSKVD